MPIYDITAQSLYTLKQQCFAKIKIQKALKGKNTYATDRSTRTEGFGLPRYCFKGQILVLKKLVLLPQMLPQKTKSPA